MNWLTNPIRVLIRKFADLSPSCKEATRLQSAAMDRKLTLSQRLGLCIHLVLCKWCRRYGTQITCLRSAAKKCEHADQHLPQQVLSSEARERIKQTLKADKGNFRP
jgi:hypothetical protein